MGAFESLHSSMHLNMLVKVSSLGETVSTANVRTIVWSFIGVNSEVVEEVVPFAEMFPTVSMVTF